jgi:hypothetical protein
MHGFLCLSAALLVMLVRERSASPRPRDVAGKTRRRVAAELISDLERIYARKKSGRGEKYLEFLLAALPKDPSSHHRE